MDLGRQWNERIKIWMDYLPRFFYKECEVVPAQFFTTFDFLSMETAENIFAHKGNVQESPKIRKAVPGLQWGAKWEYGWFKYSVKLPKSVAGKRIVCRPDTGSESLVFVNGKASGSFDRFHKFITLSQKAEGGETFRMMSETYAGHGVRPENGGPYAEGEVPVPEPSETQVTIGNISWGIWNEEVYQVAMDAFTLYSLLSVLPETSLRGQKVADALKKFTLIADYELPEAERTASIIKAGEVLKPALACVNGSTAPEMSIFGQSHLDLAWLWPLEETKHKCARTYSNQLALMEEYPEYRFLACEPIILETIKELYPELYGRILEKVENGQIFGDGAFWVENDTNLPCGEALIRQFVRGRRWFRENWNADAVTAWLPDSFGFSGAMPQILAGCGVKYFTTQKLLRIDPECDQFPYNNFWWQGIDGTKILSHIYKKNNAVYTAAALSERWNKDRIQKEDIDGMIFPYGYGDGGGGPTRDMVETVRRTTDLEGLPRAKYATLSDFFTNLESKQVKNVYRGELYLSWHRGAYTSQAKTKRYNRLAEVALHDAEYWCAVASMNGAGSVYAEKLDGLWQKLLLCQFHDILSGTSIKRVHDDAEKMLIEVMEGAGKLAVQALCKAAGAEIIEETSEECGREGESVEAENTRSSDARFLVYNTLPWERQEFITDEKTGMSRKILLPACGYTVVSGTPADSSEGVLSGGEGAVSCCTVNENGESSIQLENEFLRIHIDGYGRLSSVYDKILDVEMASAPCNSLSMYKDVTPFYDAWELAPMYQEMPVSLDDAAEFEIVENTVSSVRIKIRREINRSRLEQELIMRSGSRRIDFITRIDWHEKHKILKVDFPLNIYADEAVSDIQFGCIRRPVHRTRQFDRDRYEVCNHKYTALTDGNRGAAVLNDCKYGVSTDGGRVSLTLLKSAVIPDMYADQGLQEMTYSLYLFNGNIAESGLVQEAYNLNNPPVMVPVKPGVESAGAGDGEQTVLTPGESLFAIDSRHIMLETVKPADDRSGRLVLRLYETSGKSGSCSLKVPAGIKTALETDMAEVPASVADAVPVAVTDRTLNLTFRPFEIKTLLLM